MANSQIPIASVHHIGYIEHAFLSDLNTARILEIYTGWVGVNFDQYEDNDVLRGDIRTFVPTGPNRVRPNIREHRNKLLQRTVTASPCAISANEDETVFAVDGASVDLKRQVALPGVTQEVDCLILSASIAARHVVYHNFTYQVTLLWAPYERLADVVLPGTQVPD
jgi:hypothetical protein